jgi:hypothetical protein
MDCDDFDDATNAQCFLACNFGNYTYEKIDNFETSKLYCYCDDLEITVCDEEYVGIGLLLVSIFGAGFGLALLIYCVCLCSKCLRDIRIYFRERNIRIENKRQVLRETNSKELELKNEINRLKEENENIKNKTMIQLQEMVDVNSPPQYDINEAQV